MSLSSSVLPFTSGSHFLLSQCRTFARMTGRPGNLQHFRYGVAKVRGRWYYRYHKPIGKANWKGYQERYIKPKDVEAKQRLVFAPKATTAQLKQSLSWNWRLPKMLAAATTPNQVLDAWILFRYRQPKRISHYFLAIKRIVQVGGCSASDWRLQVLLGRMRKGYKRVLNLDVLLSYFSQLNLFKEIELITRILKSRIQSMSTTQQITVMKSLANCQLRDAAISGKCIRYIRRQIPTLSTNDMIDLVNALGKTEIRDSKFVSQLVSRLLVSDMTLFQFKQLLTGLYDLRFRDYAVIEFAAARCLEVIETEDTREYPTLCDIAWLIHKFGVHEETLVLKIIDNIDPFCLPVDSGVKIVLICSCDAELRNCSTLWLRALKESVPLIVNPETIINSILAIDKFRDQILLNQLVSKFILCNSPTTYNVSSVAKVFLNFNVTDRAAWMKIFKDISGSVEDFDPVDLIQMSAVLVDLELASETQKTTIANIVCEWALKRWEEFTPSQWKELQQNTSALQCSEWGQTELQNWGNILSQTRKTYKANSISV